MTMMPANARAANLLRRAIPADRAGSKNHKTHITGSRSKEQLGPSCNGRAYEVAMEGDSTMLKFFLGGPCQRINLLIDFSL